MKTRLRLLAAALAGLFSISTSVLNAARDNIPKDPAARDKNAPLEFPLILKSERAALLNRSPSLRKSRLFFNEQFYYHVISPRAIRSTLHNFEPFGFHVDANPFNGPEPIYAVLPGPGKHKLPPSKEVVFTMGDAAIGLALFSRKNVLLSARLETRPGKCPAWPERLWDENDFIRQVIEPNGGKVVALGDDAYVMLEASDHQLEFTLGKTRPRQYEQEREAWLLEHPYYSAQGLIYQPTRELSLAEAKSPERGAKVRHAAAALAKLTGKEVFVQPAVEKRAYSAPVIYSPESELLESALELMTLQLGLSNVRLIELDSRSLALVTK